MTGGGARRVGIIRVGERGHRRHQLHELLAGDALRDGVEIETWIGGADHRDRRGLAAKGLRPAFVQQPLGDERRDGVGVEAP